MDFKKIVGGLLKDNERSVAWLSRELDISHQVLRYALSVNNPSIKLIKGVAEVFGMTEVEFIKLGEKY